MPGKIDVVGLGPGNPELRPLETRRLLERADRIVLCAGNDQDLADLLRDPRTVVYDDIDDSGDPELGWSRIAERLVALAQDGTVVLATTGQPAGLERSLECLLDAAAEAGIAIEIHTPISIVDSVAAALAKDPHTLQATVVDAVDLMELSSAAPFEGGRLRISPARMVIVRHLESEAVAAGVRRQLSRLYPGDHEVVIVHDAGAPHARVQKASLRTLETIEFGATSAVVVPALPELEAGRDPRTLQHIVARLRQPDGCPWDRKQTITSLRDPLIDEVYEVVDAIDAGDMENLAEELGDLFLLIAMHAQIAEEAGHFTLEDVYDGIATKIVRRHPHVFGTAAAENADQVVGLWQQIKTEERAGGKNATKAADGQPHAMPALERARRVLTKRPLARTVTDVDPLGDRLLAVVAGIIDAGDDPDALLRAALERHVSAGNDAS
jgi:tetrapyrrole methylase family protein / MazG family protein